MNISRTLRPALLAAAMAAGFAGQAQASTASASITIDSISFTLNDLNPNDNVAASLSFVSGVPVSVYTGQTGTVTVSPTALGWDTDSWVQQLNDSFILSAFTSVTWTIKYTLSAAAAAVGESAAASLSMGLSGVGLFGSGTQSSTDLASVSASFSQPGQTISGTLGTDFANFTNRSMLGNLTGSASVTATGYTVTPVPEPGSYALFVAGLAAVGAVARRRRLG